MSVLIKGMEMPKHAIKSGTKDTLNTEQSRRRQQMHVCPLQLDTVERLINRYSNKGDKVLDFFGGIMTVPYLAVKRGRYGVGIELNSDYFRDGVAYCKQADLEKSYTDIV